MVGVPEGPRWTREEADQQAHRFLAQLVGGRETRWDDDPLVYARENSLLLLVGERERAAFETLLVRMPRERAKEWRDLLGGGTSSEAFGPLTLQERLDERQVEQALVQGRRQRLVNAMLGTAIIALVVVGAVMGYRRLTDEDERTTGTLRFDDPVESVAESVAGGPPVAEAALTSSLDTPVAVAPGEGPAAERSVVAPFADFPLPPGSLRASLFEFDGVGQVAVVGPDGWISEPVCLRATVATEDLRALDTTWFESSPGACVEPVGRAARPVCLGDTAVVIDLRIPQGAVPLPEGGQGFADAVRVQLVGPPGPEYEVLSVRGVIAVADEDDVTIPRFGGDVGDEVLFDLGADRSGSCTITGAVQ